MEIANILTDYIYWHFIASGLVKSKEIHADYSLLDKEDGAVLWSISYHRESVWTQSANEIINHVNRRAAKVFPYRIKP